MADGSALRATLPSVAKRRGTSRPRADRVPQQRAAKPGATRRAAGPEPGSEPPARPPRRGPGLAARALATVRRFGFLLVLLAAIGGGVLVGVMQGRGDEGQGFGDATTSATTHAPFRSNQDDVRGQPAKQVFAHTCGTCHTLRAAGVTGIAGPNLDRLDLTATRVRQIIRTGSLDSAMPANLLEGDDADRVARYVARASRASRGK
jgi:mono/diheme cytochrome c family protein